MFLFGKVERSLEAQTTSDCVSFPVVHLMIEEGLGFYTFT